MTWVMQPLPEVADLSLGKMLDEQKNSGFAMRYLANVNVRWGSIDVADLREMRFEQHELDRFSLRYGDIVMCEGGEPGRCAVWKVHDTPMMIQKALHRIRPRSHIDSSFLFYSLFYAARSGKLAPLFTGATIKHLPKEKLQKVQIAVPDLPTQRRIADILSAYDDLIENNRRRIALLEQAARELYREWFVRLRFPGHEHVKIVDGVPEGWKVNQIDEIASVRRGASPRPINDFMGGPVPWLKIGDATASGSPFVFATKEGVTEEGARRSVLLADGDLVLSNSATCGIPFFIGMDACIHDGWLYFKDVKLVSKNFLYLAFQNERDRMLSGIGEGAVQKNFNTDYVGKQTMLIPPVSDVLPRFEAEVASMFAMIKLLAVQNSRLSSARDLLLPRLMNGSIAV